MLRISVSFLGKTILRVLTLFVKHNLKINPQARQAVHTLWLSSSSPLSLSPKTNTFPLSLVSKLKPPCLSKYTDPDGEWRMMYGAVCMHFSQTTCHLTPKPNLWRKHLSWVLDRKSNDRSLLSWPINKVVKF